MKIDVKCVSQPQNITVMLMEDGEVYECNHAGGYIEQLDCGWADDRRGDWVEDMADFWTCDKCDYQKLMEIEVDEFSDEPTEDDDECY